MSSQIDLEQELRELGRTLFVAPPPDDLAERVLVRVRTKGRAGDGCRPGGTG